METARRSILAGRRSLNRLNGLRRTSYIVTATLLLSFFVALFPSPRSNVAAQVPGPQMIPPGLGVRTVVAGLTTPTTMAFIGSNQILVLEKNTGRVQRVVNGVVQGTALDLAVNFASERGLLGIALHPDFPTNPRVYLFWTESTTGADTNVLENTPLLGNRVDRFIWNGFFLTFESNIIRLRAIQDDGSAIPPDQGDLGQPARGNHDGGVLAFGPDRKLYVLFGDVGRRGQMQNLPSGPTQTGLGPTVPDDQFGGPQPDNAHLSGVILRLNDDGTSPADNPFFAAGAAMGGEAGANIQKVFAYGVRNGFGLAFDPLSGNLWDAENGDDSFDEVNRVQAGHNGGWIQFMGPAVRISQYKSIEVASGSLQQLRWPPDRIANSTQEALSRLFVLPGSRYVDPMFSWRHAMPPAGIGFVNGGALGPRRNGLLLVGMATAQTMGGPLFRFSLSADRSRIRLGDPRLRDRVADNNARGDIAESENLVIGRNFGIVTDIETGPNGNVFVVSLSQGAIFEIFRR